MNRSARAHGRGALRRAARLALLWLAAGGLGVTPAAWAVEPQDRATGAPDGALAGDRRSRAVREAFAARDYARALSLLEDQRARSPKDPLVAYNRACALAMLGRLEEADESLLDAVSWGFADLWHMERDPHLANAREQAGFRAIINGWGRLLDARGDAEASAALEGLGAEYTLVRDPVLRLSYVSALAPESLERARREVAAVEAWARARVPSMMGVVDGAGGGAGGERPDPWVLIVLPTARDFVRLVGAPGVGGFYDRDRRRLVAQDIGASLRHEFMHVLHWRFMDRAGQRHGHWAMEGLASLLEDVDVGEGGVLVPAPSWRTNIARRLERGGALLPIKRLVTLDQRGFMGSTSRAHYAQARAIMLMLDRAGALDRWFAAHAGGGGAEGMDAGGASAALASALGVPEGELDERLRGFVRGLEEVGEISRPGAAGLGATYRAGAPDGVVVDEVLLRAEEARPRTRQERGPAPERLRRRDVILSIDDRPAPTLDELQRILGEAEVGARVKVRVRRGTVMLDLDVELVDQREVERRERERPPGVPGLGSP